MEDSTTLVNLSDFKQNLIDKVKLEFANLIPAEAMERFIAETISNFEKNELPKLMTDVLREHVKEQIKQMLNSNIYGNWNYEKNMYEMTPLIEKFLIDAAPKMFASMMTEGARLALHQLQYQH